MVKERDLSTASLKSLAEDYDFTKFDDSPWTPTPPPEDRHLAIVSTAGLHRRDDRPFGIGAFDWRALPHRERRFWTTHTSVNWDRTGLTQDLNVALPLDRLEDAIDEGLIGSIADTHYAFNGGTYGVDRYEAYAKDVAGQMKADGVNTVLLSPV